MNEVKFTCDILLMTYNHEEYIERAVRSILNQDTTFSLNIIVADDCSSDGTIHIVESILTGSNSRFTIVRNDKQLGIVKNYQKAFGLCRNKYIAVLEGDDYWLNQDRLQIHIDFLEEHEECSFSYNRILLLDQIKGECSTNSMHRSAGDNSYNTVRQLCRDNFIGNYSACVYRGAYVELIDQGIFDLLTYDWFFNINMARFGLIGSLNFIGSAYRIHAKGAYSGLNIRARWKQTKNSIISYDRYLGNIFSKEFHEYIKLHAPGLLGRHKLGTILKRTIPRRIRSILHRMR